MYYAKNKKNVSKTLNTQLCVFYQVFS